MKTFQDAIREMYRSGRFNVVDRQELDRFGCVGIVCFVDFDTYQNEFYFLQDNEMPLSKFWTNYSIQDVITATEASILDMAEQESLAEEVLCYCDLMQRELSENFHDCIQKVAQKANKTLELSDYSK